MRTQFAGSVSSGMVPVTSSRGRQSGASSRSHGGVQHNTGGNFCGCGELILLGLAAAVGIPLFRLVRGVIPVAKQSFKGSYNMHRFLHQIKADAKAAEFVKTGKEMLGKHTVVTREFKLGKRSLVMKQYGSAGVELRGGVAQNAARYTTTEASNGIVYFHRNKELYMTGGPYAKELYQLTGDGAKQARKAMQGGKSYTAVKLPTA